MSEHSQVPEAAVKALYHHMPELVQGSGSGPRAEKEACREALQAAYPALRESILAEVGEAARVEEPCKRCDGEGILGPNVAEDTCPTCQGTGIQPLAPDPEPRFTLAEVEEALTSDEALIAAAAKHDWWDLLTPGSRMTRAGLIEEVVRPMLTAALASLKEGKGNPTGARCEGCDKEQRVGDEGWESREAIDWCPDCFEEGKG